MSGWEKIISDPRKNMLLDIKNANENTEGLKNLEAEIEGQKIQISEIDGKSSVFAIKEYCDYSEAEQQFLLPE